MRRIENRGKSLADLMNTIKDRAPVAAIFFLASALAACSKDNPVAPQLAPDYDCRACPSGGYCPLECYPK